MIIYPAIDLRNGKCVRLYQGDYARETTYYSDPFSLVKKLATEGARWLHIVDLDGAKHPHEQQSELILALIKESGVNVQTGGGIRTKQQVANLLERGAERVVIGSLAVTQAGEVANWIQYFGPERVVLALDVIMDEQQQALVAVNAWQQASQKSLFELIDYYQTVGLKHLLCTNIALDGTLKGPDITLYEKLCHKYTKLNIQASGGIQSVADVQRLQAMQLDGAIIGRALYENKFTLSEVLVC